MGSSSYFYTVLFKWFFINFFHTTRDKKLIIIYYLGNRRITNISKNIERRKVTFTLLRGNINYQKVSLLIYLYKYCHVCIENLSLPTP